MGVYWQPSRLIVIVEKIFLYLNLMPKYNPGECKTKVIIPPDGGLLAWFNVTLAFLQNCFIHPIALCYYATVDFKTYGIFGAIFVGLRVMFVPIASAISNCHGFRIVSFIGSVIIFVSFTLCFFVGDGILSGFLFSIGGVLGLGSSMIYSCAFVLPNLWFSRKRVIVNFVSSMGKPIGTLITPWLIELIIKKDDYNEPIKYTLLYLGLGCIPLLIMSFFMGNIAGSNIKITKSHRKTGTKKVTFHDYEEADYLASNLDQLEESCAYKIFNVHNNLCYPSVQDIVGLNAIEATISSRYQMSCIDYPMKRQPNPFCYQNITLVMNPSVVRSGARPFYRTDIFFEGNIGKLTKYRTQETQLDYHMGMTRAPTAMDLMQEEERKCRREAFFRVLVTMWDFSILKCPSIMLIMVVMSTSTIGFHTPYILLKERAINLGYSFRTSLYFYFFFGFGNLFGKLMGSMLLIFVNMFTEEIFYAHILFLGGVASIASNFTDKYYYHVCYSVLLGAIGGLSNLRLTIIFNAAGLDNLTNVMGVYSFFDGMSAFLGIAFAVLLKITIGSYAWIYTIFGSFLILSAILLYPARLVKMLVRNKRIIYV